VGYNVLSICYRVTGNVVSLPGRLSNWRLTFRHPFLPALSVPEPIIPSDGWRLAPTTTLSALGAPSNIIYLPTHPPPSSNDKGNTFQRDDSEQQIARGGGGPRRRKG